MTFNRERRIYSYQKLQKKETKYFVAKNYNKII